MPPIMSLTACLKMIDVMAREVLWNTNPFSDEASAIYDFETPLVDELICLRYGEFDRRNSLARGCIPRWLHFNLFSDALVWHLVYG